MHFKIFENMLAISLYWFAVWQFRCTGLLWSSKLVHLDGKKLVWFTQSLVQNLMNLVIISKNKSRALKHALN